MDNYFDNFYLMKIHYFRKDFKMEIWLEETLCVISCLPSLPTVRVNTARERERFDKTIQPCQGNHGWIVPGVMVDQREALAVTNGLTDTVYLVSPTGILTVNPWVSKQQPCILPLSYLVLG